MITIYHNNRCKKSREGLEKVKESGKEYNVREYSKNPLTEEELTGLLEKLSFHPIQLVRQNEKLWKEEYKGKDLSDRELIMVMVKHPKLIERPIVENKYEAVVGRPTSAVEKIL